jgi:hypothetical protein
MSIYDRARATARRLLDPAKLGAPSGAVVLIRRTVTPPANSWETPNVLTETETLSAQVFGVSKELVGLPATEPGNGVILASDRMCIAAVPAMGYTAGDLLAIDDRPVMILRVWNIPAAGTPSVVKFAIRG